MDQTKTLLTEFNRTIMITNTLHFKLTYWVWGIVGFLFTNTLLAQTSDFSHGCIPFQVHFTAPSGSANWYWDFADGTFSTLANPDHIFSSAGNFQVKLFEGSGGPLIGSLVITAYNPQKLEYELTTVPPCVGNSVQFTDKTQYDQLLTVNSYTWVFGDGSTGQGSNPAHIYLTPGTYTISLAIKTNLPGCDITKIFSPPLEIFSNPQVEVLSTPQFFSSCIAPFEISYQDASTGNKPFTYEWIFGNGNTSNLPNPAKQVYPSLGNYASSLKIIDKNGCTNTKTWSIKVNPNPLDIFIPSSICLGDTLKIINKSDPGLMYWNFQGGSPISTSQPSPKVFFNTPGKHAITFNYQSPQSNCKIDTTFYVDVEQIKADFTSDVDNHCSAPVNIAYHATVNAKDYTWTLDKFGVKKGKDVTLTYPNDLNDYSTASYRYLTTTLAVKTEGGCIDTIVKIDTLQLTIAAFTMEDYKICPPTDSATFYDHSITLAPKAKWTWVFGDGTQLVKFDSLPVKHLYDACDTFQPFLVIEDINGCIDTSYKIKVKVCGCLLPFDPFQDPGGTCTPGPSQTTCGFHCQDCVPTKYCGYHAYAKDYLLKFIDIPPNFYGHLFTDGRRVSNCETPSITPVYTHETGVHDVELGMLSYFGDVYLDTAFNFICMQGAWPRINFKLDCSDRRTVTFWDSIQCLGNAEFYWSVNGLEFYDHQFNYTFPGEGDYEVILYARDSKFPNCPYSEDKKTIKIRDINVGAQAKDYHVCVGQEVELIAEESPGIFSTCRGGYTWYLQPDYIPYPSQAHSILEKFDSPGEKTIYVAFTDINGCMDSTEFKLEAHSVEAKMDLPDKICLPKNLPLISSSIANQLPITKYQWKYQDSIIFDVQNGTLILDVDTFLPGDYFTIQLYVENIIGCKDTTSKKISIYKPVSSIQLQPEVSEICTGTSLKVFATDFTECGSYLDYQWTFGNGNTSTLKETQQEWSTSGAKLIQLIFKEHASGCTDTINRAIQVQDYPKAEIGSDLPLDTILCHPQKLQFYNFSSGSSFLTNIEWKLAPNVQSFENNPSYSYPKGTHTVSLIVGTSAGCADTASVTFKVAGPEGNFEFDKSSICIHEPITLTLKDTVDVGDWTWDFGDGNLETKGSPVTHSYNHVPPNDTIVATLVLKDFLNHCTYHVVKTVPLIPIEAGFTVKSTDSIFCGGQKLNLINISKNAKTQSWFVNGQFVSSAQNYTVELPQTGSIQVKLAIAGENGTCPDTFEQTILVKEFILPLISDTICSGDIATIGFPGNLSNMTWKWSPTSGIDQPTAPLVNVAATNSTWYTLTGTHSSGCIFKDSVYVKVFDGYPGQLAWDTLVPLNSTITLPTYVGANWTYQWTPPDPLSCSNCPNPTTVAVADTVFTLTVHDDVGCFLVTIPYSIRIDIDSIDIPNIFTPNGNSKNDFFNIIIFGGDISDVSILEFKIFNRWGTVVYDNTNTARGWDGNYKEEPAPMDLYVYVIELQLPSGKKEKYTGEVNLIR